MHTFQVEGTLSVQPQANPVVGFEEHFLSLTVENNERNPWFVGKRARSTFAFFLVFFFFVFFFVSFFIE